MVTATVFNLRKVMSKHIISESVPLILHCLIWSHWSFMVIFHQPHWTLGLAHHTLIQSIKYLENWVKLMYEIGVQHDKWQLKTWRGWLKILLFSFLIILIPVLKTAAYTKALKSRFSFALGTWLKCLEEEHTWVRNLVCFWVWERWLCCLSKSPSLSL